MASFLSSALSVLPENESVWDMPVEAGDVMRSSTDLVVNSFKENRPEEGEAVLLKLEKSGVKPGKTIDEFLL